MRCQVAPGHVEHDYSLCAALADLIAQYIGPARIYAYVEIVDHPHGHFGRTPRYVSDQMRVHDGSVQSKRIQIQLDTRPGESIEQ